MSGRAGAGRERRGDSSDGPAGAAGEARAEGEAGTGDAGNVDSGDRPDEPPAGTADAPLCDLCGSPLRETHCKLICDQCGYTRDCSDP